MKMNSILALPIVAACLIVLCVFIDSPTTAPREPVDVAVKQNSYACPIQKGTSVATGRAEPQKASQTKAIELPSKKAISALSQVDRWNEAQPGGRAVLVDARNEAGSGSVGFFASKSSPKSGDQLIVGSCPGIRGDAWYLGAGSGDKHLSTVQLTNVGSTQAVGSIKLWNEDGPVDAVDSEGIVLKPFQSKKIKIASLAAGESELALQVTSQRGAMSVSAMDTAGTTVVGSDVLPETASPSLRQIVSGLPSGAKDRTLMVVNPGKSTARLHIESLETTGAVVPEGLKNVKVGPGRIRLVKLPKSVGEKGTALRIDADQRISAAVRLAPNSSDFSYAVATPILDSPAIAPLSIGDVIRDGTLMVTASKKPAHVSVTAYNSKLQAEGTTKIELKADTTKTLNLAKGGMFSEPFEDLAYVVVRADGPVTGAVQYRRGDAFSVLPLRAAPTTTLAPQVRPVP